MRPALFVLFTTVVCCASSRLGAQSVSLQVGVSTFGANHEPEVGVRASPAANDIVGMDFAFDMYPRLLVFGVIAGVTDLSLAARVRPAAAVSFEGRAGGSALLGVGEGGAIAFTGYHAGAVIIVTADPRTTVRLDFTYRRLRLGGESSTIPSLTFGFLVHQ